MPGLKFRVLLDSVKEQEVFRDIIVNDDKSFEAFYETILESFDFSNDQMGSFFVSDSDWNKGEELSLMDMSFGAGDADEAPAQMSDLMIRERIEAPNQRFILVYDFLNMWIFLIELQDILSEEVTDSKVVLKVGDIPEKMRKEGTNALENMQFETELSDDLKDFDFDEDEFGDSDFENIDDFDI